MDNLDLIEVNDLSAKANGGTEQMLKRVYSSLPRELLQEFQIIPTRVRELKEDKYRIYWVHDLVGDNEVHNALVDGGWHRFHKIVFVSNWIAQQFINQYQIPWSKTVVLLNAITPIDLTGIAKPKDQIKLIYHSTPHRGLQILLPVFSKLREKYPNIHLDVYSSFGLYGWEQRDEEFKNFFEYMEQNKDNGITSHGAVSNDEVRKALANAHIFAFPSIWPETSCLCLMEAMSAGLNCVHSNFAALYETAANWTSMYCYHEDQNEHAKLFYSMMCNAIEHVNDPNMQGRLDGQRVYTNAFYNWETRAKQWEALLNSILMTNDPREIIVPEEEFVYHV